MTHEWWVVRRMCACVHVCNAGGILWLDESKLRSEWAERISVVIQWMKFQLMPSVCVLFPQLSMKTHSNQLWLISLNVINMSISFHSACLSLCLTRGRLNNLEQPRCSEHHRLCAHKQLRPQRRREFEEMFWSLKERSADGALWKIIVFVCDSNSKLIIT